MGGNTWDVESPEERLRRILEHLDAATRGIRGVYGSDLDGALRNVLCARSHAQEALAEMTAGAQA